MFLRHGACAAVAETHQACPVSSTYIRIIAMTRTKHHARINKVIVSTAKPLYQLCGEELLPPETFSVSGLCGHEQGMSSNEGPQN